MKKTLLSSLLATLLVLAQPTWAQQASTGMVRQLTLQETIDLALSSSIASKQATTNKTRSYWQYRTFKANYLPQLSLTGTVPNMSRSIVPVVQPDGTTDFRAVSISNSELALTASQAVGVTGGQFFISTQSQRFDDFNRNQRQYNSFPAI